MANDIRAEIVVAGLVQGVGFRYFVMTNAERLNISGYTKNVFSGEVLTILEGPRFKLEEMYEKIKVGPMYSQVKKHSVTWSDSKNEFTRFEVRH